MFLRLLAVAPSLAAIIEACGINRGKASVITRIKAIFFMTVMVLLTSIAKILIYL